jgi:tetratricopeptide (TPR) repeat protein
MNRRRPVRTAIVGLAAGCLLEAPTPAAFQDPAAVRRQAFDLAYNLDHDEALALLRRSVAAHPDDPASHRALASVVWLTLLYQRGAVTVDHYLGSFSRTQVELSKPPAALDAEFRKHVERAIQLAEARTARAPRDIQARYDLGAAVGLQASHVATVQGKMFAGFKAARRAYDEHETVLELDPSRKEAAMVVGTYRYVVSTLSLPLRMMAYVAGFGGGKERGIQMIQETAAARDCESQTDAMFALVLLFNRERRYDEAMRVLGELRRLYPRNRLAVLESGSTALRAGRAAEAESFFTQGLAVVARETRPLMPGERALWHYKRGAARLARANVDGARADLELAVESSAQDWVKGRANAELARLALRGGERERARTFAARAEALCQQGNDPPCVDDAQRSARSARGR